MATLAPASRSKRGDGSPRGIGGKDIRNSARGRPVSYILILRMTLTSDFHAAVVASSAELGRGTVVMGCATINSEARLGEGVIVNTGAVVEHDVEIGDYAHISPNASLGGASRLGTGSHLGLGAVVLPGVSVGSESIIGAGAVVLKDLPSKIVAVGVPARILRRM